MSNLLEQITQPNDIKKIPEEQLPQLAIEIRKLILATTSKNGGHLASSLGTVELTMALHRCMDFPEDKLIWDVGHQSYTHKILTGRKDRFPTLRTYGGISGFPKRAESPCDAFDTGHSSTSVSVAAGMAKARQLRGTKERVVAVIGDGSLSGGLAYEGLNNIGRFKTNLIIVLNDNEMSISRNVGSMANYLGRVRMSSNYIDFKGNLEQVLNRSAFGERLAKGLKKTKDSIRQMIIPGEFFTEMGLTYFGPIDGHDIALMERAFHAAEKISGPVLLHVVTKKGKGYRYAEAEPSRFHGIDPFRLATGEQTNGKKKETFTDCFGKAVAELGREHSDVVAITAAMTGGTGLSRFQSEFPDRFFDVGIAEEHAVTFAAGLAASGLRPVVAVYSTFLQRAYDQIVHDVALGNLPVTFAIDRAGIVGNDGETHQGIFDLAYLSHIPNLTVMAPSNGEELAAMLRFAHEAPGPVAIRYPRGNVGCERLGECGTQELAQGKAEVLHREREIALMFVGPYYGLALQVRELLRENGRSASIINARFAAPFDRDCVRRLAEEHSLLVTIEEGVGAGGFGERLAAFVMEERLPMRVLPVALPDRFLAQAEQQQLREMCGLTKEAIFAKIKRELEA
ncbi:MAG: 1-deoxy-D-xylulose-5-phosphate synthase [Lachnospiraceae bacterium]|nr:1-deoxy-D-xylulose-5-phosphate synthase [Lachnospiraceae bacterium]